MLRNTIILTCLCLCSSVLNGQRLQPGFDKQEYIELLKVSARTTAVAEYYDTFPAPERFQMIYQSPEIGLENLWDLWLDEGRRTAVISVRGTTQNSVSWLANFYAAMVPARGALHLAAGSTFPYDLSDHPQAAVHIGWLVSMAFIAQDMGPRLDSLLGQDVRDVLIVGHSQGGAIVYLLAAFLHRQIQLGVLPADLRLKTYASAGPKPGNLYFAYTYEHMTKGGWAFNVVNSADWVPEVPISIQTLEDFNRTNPFAHIRKTIRQQGFPKSIALRHLYNKLDKPTRQARKNYQKYLGKIAAGFVQKTLPEYQPPAYYLSNHYVRTGQIIVLHGDEAYSARYPDSDVNAFVHHVHAPYLYLAERY